MVFICITVANTISIGMLFHDNARMNNSDNNLGIYICWTNIVISIKIYSF